MMTAQGIKTDLFLSHQKNGFETPCF